MLRARRDGISFRRRRQLALLTTCVALTVVAAVVFIQHARLAQPAFFTGLTLYTAILFLLLLGVRRRLPTPVLGNVRDWTQLHLYTGLFSVGVYVLHVPALIGNGIFESGLSILFLLVAGSGIYGIIISRTIPKQLTAIAGESRFDQIGWQRQQVADKATALLGEISQHSSVGVIEAWYQTELTPFLVRPPSLGYLLTPSGRRRRRLLAGLQELERYIEPDCRPTTGRLAALVRRRDDLDYQYALQLRLRLWLIFHGLMSVALLVCASVHGILAWRFAGW
jgi:hypothetical protein